MEGGVPEDIADFITRHIESVAQLEAMLLLRTNAAEVWSAELLSQRLYIREAEGATVLASLVECGIAQRDGNLFRYRPNSEELRKRMDRLADAYSRQLIPITNLIHAKPRRIQQFADAFKFRKGS